MKRKCKIVKVVSIHGQGIVFKDSTSPHPLLKNSYKDNNISFSDCNYYDIYIVTDEDIVKKGDWFVDEDNEAYLCEGVDSDFILNKHNPDGWNFLECRKVVATTNEYIIEQKIIPKISDSILDGYLESDGKDDRVKVEFDVTQNIDEEYMVKKDKDNVSIVEMDNKEVSFNERQMEMVFCLGILNQGNVTMSELVEQMPELKHKFALAKRFVLEN